MAYLRLPFCSPYKLVWPLLVKPKTAAAVIHRSYARYVWQMKAREVLGRILLYGIIWPLPFAYLSWKHTSRLGKRVKLATGKGHLKQVCEQFWIALCYSISPKKYYVFELFRPERLRYAAAYVARYEFKGGLHTFLETRIDTPTRRILNDKAAFFRHCQSHGISTIPTYFLINKDGTQEKLLPFQGDLPAADLFVKPCYGRGGRGCERWQYKGDGLYCDQNGLTHNVAELLAHLRVLASHQPILVQQAMQPHPALDKLSVNVLTSCRMMTVKNEQGGFEATHAVFKSSTKPGAIVDNFHKGGIVSRVDIKTGELGPASDAGVGQPCVWYDTHPLTGAQIKGHVLPLWNETVALITRAHAAFPDRITIGWDVAISSQGPVIIEGNVQSGCDMIQRTHDVPAGIGRLAECYAYHVTRAFERDMSQAWKTRKGLA